MSQATEAAKLIQEFLDNDGRVPGTDLCTLLYNTRLELLRLDGLINTPETEDFLKGIQLEAAHQEERWGADHDEGKGASDWYWLIGHLAGKALMAAISGDLQKAKHHVITTAAALANWHRKLCGSGTMRPGIADPVVIETAAFKEGRKAYLDGRSMITNPYILAKPSDSAQWALGYRAAAKQDTQEHG